MKKLSLIFLMAVSALFATDYKIPEHLYNYMRTTWNEDSTVLELGSGSATGHLVEHFRVYSIEDDIDFLNLYDADYIYAPLRKNWYDREAITRFAPEHYDFILVDGPRDFARRINLLENLDLFNTSVPIIINNVHEKPIYELMEKLSQKIGRPFKVYLENEKAFAVI